MLIVELTKKHKPFYLTFGSIHAHPKGYFLIWAIRESDADAMAFKMFGNKFAFLKNRDTWIREYNDLSDLVKVREIILE